MRIKHVILTGGAIGLEDLTNLTFRPDKPYRCCLLCGAVYQTELDREFPHSLLGKSRRQVWAENHAKQHPQSLHVKLFNSPNFALPEAAKRLAAYGIFSLNDLAIDDEVSDALRQSSPVPVNDAEC